jgi:dihydroorotase
VGGITTQGPSTALIDGRKRGLIFDVGHGAAGFQWRTAVPLMKVGFIPDSISTDLHIRSMTAGMKDMLNVMSKFLAMDMSIEDVIARSTWNPAREIQLQELGNLSVGSPADVAVLRLEKGRFGLVDWVGGRLDATQRLGCEITIRNGKVVYDLNGMTSEPWEMLRPGGRSGDPRWDDSRPPRPPTPVVGRQP